MAKPYVQQVFDKVIATYREAGYTVYPELPMKDVPYPFIVVREVQVIPRQTSSGMVGKVFVTLDVWGDKRQRSIVAEIFEKTYRICSKIVLEGNHLILVVNASNGRILSDTSTPSVLWHGVQNLEFNIAI